MTSPAPQPIPTDSVLLGQRQRAVDPDVVDILAESIADIGLLQPIGVLKQGPYHLLIYGAHRWTAMKQLGHTQLPALVFEGPVDKPGMELAENYLRKQLSPLELSDALFVQKAIHEVAHPETMNGAKAPGSKKDSPEVNLSGPEAYTTLAARQMSMSRKQVYQYLKLQKIRADLRIRIREELPELAHTLKELLSLASMIPTEQELVVKTLCAGEATSVHDARMGRKTPEKMPRRHLGQCGSLFTKLPLEERGEFLREVMRLELPPGYKIICPVEHLDD